MMEILKDNLITMVAVILIFLSGVGIGAAITDRIISREEEIDEAETENTTKAINGWDDTKRSKNALDL